jgi:putative SOS response-associated peptidase YedK
MCGRFSSTSLKWGLVPRWAKDPSGANRMINLRAETVREKKGWKSTLARRRCIIPIDGFYEWQDQGKGQRKQPFYITSRDFTPLALAGLWATWRDPDSGEELFTCTILTTSANDLMEPVHHRMPVILAPEDWDSWLDPENTDTEELAKLLAPAPEEMLTLWPVDPAVGNVRNNRPELQEPLEGHQPITA